MNKKWATTLWVPFLKFPSEINQKMTQIFSHHLEREQTHFKNHYKKQLAGANRDKKNTFTSELNYIYRQKNLNKHIV